VDFIDKETHRERGKSETERDRAQGEMKRKRYRDGRGDRNGDDGCDSERHRVRWMKR
jgi:hypothetical protein